MRGFVYPEEIECVLEPINGVGGLYISNLEAAENLATLKKRKIFAVVTVARGLQLRHSEAALPRYLYIPADDTQSFNLREFFQTSNKFIADSIKITNVLVHCAAGISRSATLVIAYLMWSCRMGFLEAYCTLKQRRHKVQPNIGFVDQLRDFQSYLENWRKSEDFRISINTSYLSTYNSPLKDKSISNSNKALRDQQKPKIQTSMFKPNSSFVAVSNKIEKNTQTRRPSSVIRPQNALIKQASDIKYGTMRMELQQLKQNIKELKNRFNRMRKDTYSVSSGTTLYSQSIKSAYSKWR